MPRVTYLLGGHMPYVTYRCPMVDGSCQWRLLMYGTFSFVPRGEKGGGGCFCHTCKPHVASLSR